MKRLWMLVLSWVALWTPVVGAAEAVRREIQFPDPPGYHTLKCDLHAHTVFSDGLVWPTVRIDEAWREGLDAIAITDHLEYQPHKEDLPTKHNRPYELAVESARRRGLLLIRGAEITRDTPPGHFNAIFLEDVAPLDVRDFYEVFERAAAQKAFVFWNHPGWQGPERGRWGEEQSRLFEKKQMHGIEICNGDEYYAEAHGWAVEKGLTLLGDSDTHGPMSDLPWTAENHRTLTLVFAREKTLESLREALNEGRTAVWCRNQLFGREEQLSALFAASVEVRPPHHRGGDAAWVEIANRCELNIDLQKAEGRGPDRIMLPARSTTVVRLDLPGGEDTRRLAYKALNLLVAPDQPLVVNLTVPPEPKRPQ